MRRVFWLFLFLIIAYIGLTYATPPDAASQQKYQLSDTEIQLLRSTLTIPIVAIWLVAYYGYSKFKRYAETIGKSKESEAWNNLVNGLLLLALYLPISSTVSSLGTYIRYKNPGLTEESVMITNFTNIILLLVSFVLLYKGASKLITRIKTPISSGWEILATGSVLVASSIFAYLTLSNQYRSNPISSSVPASYYLPDWLLIITIVIPYIIVFYLGAMIVKDVHIYRIHEKGSLYKSALKHLANGIGVTVISIMSLRYLASMSSVFNDATLKAILGILYILVFIIAAGYVLIALGAKKLQKIEEV